MMRLTPKTGLKIAAVSAATALVLSACGSGDGGNTDGDGGGDGGNAGGATTIEHWLWDDVQLPMYEACATAFTEANSDISINITQTAWAQYWQNLTTNFASATGPDTFTMTVQYAQEYNSLGQLADLDEIGATTDVDFDAYVAGTAENYLLDDTRVGLPLDWDIVGLVYDETAATEAGLTADDINALEFDGTGEDSFTEFIKAMALDANGNNGLSPEFDSANVERFGMLPEWSDGFTGQNGWGNLAHALGWTFFTEDGSLNFDAPELVTTLEWYQSMIDLGVMQNFDETSTLGQHPTMEAGLSATTLAGSWNASNYLADTQEIDFAWAKVPEGPAGRFAATNSLAAVVWSGSDQQEAAAKWVNFLGSPACQDMTGEFGIVFPAVQSGTDAAVEANAANGSDVPAFAEMAAAGETYQIPSFTRNAEIRTIMQDAIWAIAAGGDVQSTLTAANESAQALVD